MESTEPSTPDGLPERIGPYKILDVLGEGGMGTVYLAEQKEPVRRRVALKVIKLGMDSKRVLARFEAERQALAMMEHDAIARVFDAGTTATGQPYFAMEHVKGVPITTYCDRNKLSLPERIGLFTSVCSAVQHAHHKGVIHRDLTPNNIMVSLADGSATPKIIDFGLARATDHRLTEKTLYTQVGTILGTPEYMSPEQAGLDGLDVDTRTDVYSLGVILYELLVGELPFASAELQKAGPLEAQRVIREVDPPRPSTKLTSLGDGSAERARLRGTDAGALYKRLKGDLDWIVMKALEKDRTRRYETPAALGDDLRRFLADEPVAARPPSVGYRVSKFVRRYKVRVALAAALVVTLVAGIIGTTRFAIEASAARETAEGQAAEIQRQKDAAESANTELAATLVRTRALGLASVAIEEIRADPTRAVLLALEAVALEDRVETRSALHRALALCHERLLVPLPERAVRADLAPDGSCFVIGTQDGTVQLWTRAGELAWEERVADAATGDDARVQALHFLGPEGERVVGGNRAGVIVLWSRDGERLHTHAPTPLRPLRGAGAVSPDRDQLLLGGVDAVQLLELAGTTGDRLELVQELAHAGRLSHAVFHPDGGWIATAGAPRARGQLWERLESGFYAEFGPLLFEPREVRALAFSDTHVLVGVSDDPDVAYDLVTHERTEFPGPEWVAWLAGPRRIVGGSTGGTMAVWSQSFEQLWATPDDESILTGTPPVPSRDGRRFAASYQDGLVRVHDGSGAVGAALLGHTSAVTTMRWGPGDRELLTVSSGSARLWDLANDELTWRPGSGLMTGVRISPDGRHVLVQGGGGLRMWNSNRELLWVADQAWQGGLAKPRFPFSTDGRRVAAVHGNWLQVFDANDGRKVLEHFDANRPGLLCVLPHSSEILWFDWDGKNGSSLSFETGAVTPGISSNGAVTALAPAPSGRWVAVADIEGELSIHERSGNAWRRAAEARIGVVVHEIAVAPDEAQILVGTYDGRILAFDRDLRQEAGVEFEGHRRQVREVRYAPDGARVASASEDGTLRLWRRDGTLLAVISARPGAVNACDFSPDGQRLLTAHLTESTIRTWFVRTEDLVAAAKARVCRELTDEERARFAELLGR